MQQTPPLRTANLLYLLSMLLVLLLGGMAQSYHVGWGLIFTEIVCILLPVLLLLRREGAPWAETLGWKPARLTTMVLAVPVGLGTWALGALLTSIMVALTGYQAPGPAAPLGTVGMIAFFLGFTLFAPVCEEVLFRGYLFRAYGALGPRAAILFSALLFAFFHLRLQGLPGLLPAAFAFGMMRWRTGSIRPSMLAHAAHNAVAASLMLLPASALESLQTLLAGGMLALVFLGIGAFALLLRLTPAPSAPPVDSPRRLRMAEGWPLIPFALLFLYMGGAEAGLLPWMGSSAGNGKIPQAVPALAAAPLAEERVWRYEMRNVVDEVVGSMECRLTPAPDSFQVACRSSNRAWRVERPNSVFQSDAGTTETVMRWSRTDLRLLEMTEVVVFGESSFRQETAVRPEGDGLMLTVSGNVRPDAQGLALPAGAVLFEEWAWRLALAEMEKAWSAPVALAWPSKWSEKLKTSVPVVEPVQLSLAPGGALGGRSKTWVASLGSLQKAWYDAEAPHTLLRLDTGVESFRLVED